jgi:hypothetical protein
MTYFTSIFGSKGYLTFGHITKVWFMTARIAQNGTVPTRFRTATPPTRFPFLYEAHLG